MVTSLVILYLISVKENIVQAHRHCENITGTNLICRVPINICPELTLYVMIVQKHTV